MDAGQHAVSGDVEPLIYQNELPVSLLTHGVVEAGAKVLGQRPGGQDCRVSAMVAIAALSTLRLDLADEGTSLAKVRQAAGVFSEASWTEALDSLARRTAELDRLLRQSAADRRQTWQQVTLENRILGEAVAAAVVGGAASSSGVPPQQWLFPFHLFCSLAVSAAKASLSTIERWLGIEFLPPHTAAERAASLAVLVADEAGTLWHGCGCKDGIDVAEVAYVPRGSCRQVDHDLRVWQPGLPKPGSRGARYASTLWGWQRRWLGGANGAGSAAEHVPARPNLHTNDVAGSVLARKWLSAARGFDGPVMLYDRILPEYCVRCDAKVQLITGTDETGRTIIQRATCCPEQTLVYRSEFTWRDGTRLVKPKLGIIVVSGSRDEGSAGYTTTAPLGPLWLCRRSGRYSLSRAYCPDAECGLSPNGEHEPVSHGWVLHPVSEAWDDLKATADSDDDDTAGALADHGVGLADLRLLADLCGTLQRRQFQFETPGDVWRLAKDWSSAEMNGFMGLGKLRGLELLFRCKEIAEAQALMEKRDQGTLNSGRPASRDYDQETLPGSERSGRDD